MLLQNPQLAYALLQAQIVMKIVDPQVALVRMLHWLSSLSGDKMRKLVKQAAASGAADNLAWKIVCLLNAHVLCLCCVHSTTLHFML